MKPLDQWGRPLEDMDIAQHRIAARDLLNTKLGDGDHSYSIYTQNGKPICGYYSGAPVHQFQTLKFA